MRELLLDSYVVTDEQMRELALQRSVAVRDALISRGVPNARMFLASPKLHDGKDPDGQAWSPRVDLSLATQ
jgi:outer membrane protein OmpA-like peptidoglycan-associated protein